MKRQYSGTAGKVENCQIGVFLAYGSRQGRGLSGSGAVSAPGMGGGRGAATGSRVPRKDVVFRTKAQLAQQMISRAVAVGAPFAWVTGDTVYGNDRRNCGGGWRNRAVPYVLAVKNNEPLWVGQGAWRGAGGGP